MMRQNLSLSTVGLEMGISVLLGVLGGQKLDEWLATEPVFFWIGLAAGFAAAGRALWVAIGKARKMLENNHDKDE